MVYSGSVWTRWSTRITQDTKSKLYSSQAFSYANVLSHSGIVSVWSLYYSREPLGRGVKAWNVQYFPTGSWAGKYTIAPRPGLSIARTVGRLLNNSTKVRDFVWTYGTKNKINITPLLIFSVLLKTSLISLTVSYKISQDITKISKRLFCLFFF